jgi:hypothetical protein
VANPAVPTTPANTAKPYNLPNPQLAAWLVLLASFAMFCGLCLGGALAARWFLFDSMRELEMRLDVGRGRVDWRAADGNSTATTRRALLSARSALETDSLSQGILTFADTESGTPILAEIYLLQDSRLTLTLAEKPRFSWSNNGYTLQLDDLSGRFVVQTYPSNRPMLLSLRGSGAQIQITEAGRYRIEADSGLLRLVAQQGEASLLGADSAPMLITAGQIATALDGQLGAPSPFDNEILNAGFGNLNDIENNPALPFGWACTSQANQQEEPQGEIARNLYDERLVLRMKRIGQGLDHAEGSCTYTFGTLPGVPKEVSEGTSLMLRAKLKIFYQDVTTCGVQGSECPVMLELEYMAKDTPPDQTLFWRHGFYAIRPAVDNNPLSCDTCLQDHEKISLDTWYLYESGDLFKLLPENKRPVKLLRLRVYASGHAYDALVSDLQVLLGR